MKKWLLILVLPVMLFAGSQSSISAETLSKMSDRERIKVLDLIKKENEPMGIPMPSSAEEVEKWSNIGNAVGKALSSTAKEMGIAVNDFSKTDVGFLVTFLIVWHFFGSMVVHILSGLFILLIGILFLRYSMNVSRNYEWKKVNDKEVKVYERIDDVTGWVFAFFLLIVISTVVIFTF